MPADTSSTTITSPMRRISSVDEDNLTEAFTPINENLDQSKKRHSSESPGQLHKKTALLLPTPLPVSYSAKLRHFRGRFSALREEGNLVAWGSELVEFCAWMMQGGDEEAAGAVIKTIREFEEEQLKGKVLVGSNPLGHGLDFYRAQALTVLGKFEDAIEACHNDPNALFLKAGLLRVTGNVPKAIEIFKKVLQQQPDNLDAHEHLYGFTCGLLPHHSMDELVKEYLAGAYGPVIRRLEGVRWIAGDGQLVLLLSSLTLCKESARLYELSQELVEERPSSTVTWYAVGCFYLSIAKMDEARKFFFKAGLAGNRKVVNWRVAVQGCPDHAISPSWLALGHSFAASGDHDQAISAYVTAGKTHSPGSLEVPLSLAIEYLRVRQPALAAAYLLQAHGQASKDARVLNELACLQATKGAFDVAVKLIKLAKDEAVTRELKLITAVNTVIIKLKESTDPSAVLQECLQLLQPFLEECQGALKASTLNSLFNWHSAQPSPQFQCLNLMAAVQEWLGVREEAVKVINCLLECRNEHRNTPLEAHLMERLNRLLGEPQKVTETPAMTSFMVPKTPLISNLRSTPLPQGQSLSASTSNGNLSNALLVANSSFSSTSSLAASVSRRRLSLRRQMSGFRFDFQGETGGGSNSSFFDSSSMDLE